MLNANPSGAVAPPPLAGEAFLVVKTGARSFYGHARRHVTRFFLKNFRLSICNPRKGQYSKARAAPVRRVLAGVLWKQNSAIRRAGICISVVAVHISQQQVKPRPV